MIAFLSAIEGLQQGRPSPAASIGMSRMQTFTRMFVEGALRPRDGDRWFLLRAASRELLSPGKVVSADARTIAEAPLDYRAAWGSAVVAELARELPAGTRIFLLLRDPWRRELEGKLRGVYQTVTPWVYKSEAEIVRWLEDALVLPDDPREIA